MTKGKGREEEASTDQKMASSQVNEEKASRQGRGLAEVVFSWSFQDVLNKDLLRGEVQRIPETFMSPADYLKSFIPALKEETRADLASSMEDVSRAPFSGVICVKECKGFKAPNNLLYKITLKRASEMSSDGEVYVPECGDLIAMTDVKPTKSRDLDRPNRPYLIALVEQVSGDTLTIISSKILEVGQYPGKKRNKSVHGDKQVDTLFAVCLTNLTTNIRIWNALTPKPDGIRMDIIKNVIQRDSINNDDCGICSSGDNGILTSLSRDIASSNLNASQEAAVMSCIAKSCCSHQSSVKLIWGPPGTGKTKTIACLLHSLLKMKCRTLTCAPTNTAVLQVAARVLKSVADSPENESYGIGDILLFGNQERMKIDDHSDFLDIFLDHRVDMLVRCLAPASGWNACLASMKSLLEDPETLYETYLADNKYENVEVDESSEGEEQNNGDGKNVEDDGPSQDRKKIWNEITLQALKETKKEDNPKTKKASRYRKRSKSKHGKNKDSLCNDKRETAQEVDKEDRPPNTKWASKYGKHSKSKQGNNKEAAQTVDHWTYEEFVKKRFKSIGVQLKFCIVNLCTHLPTSVLPPVAAKNMIEALDLLNCYEKLLSNSDEGGGSSLDVKVRGGKSLMLDNARLICLHSLEGLPQEFQIGNHDKYSIRMFCLKKAHLLFCTASSSAKLQKVPMKPVQMLVIDEAAQLKECESAIPLQLSGFRHAILVGDEMQLTAMVTSKISKEAQFGRSLFQRLAKLGWKKHLLNIQYRMHPSISKFANREFYNRRILNAPNVEETGYRRRFLEGNMFGSYSFINVGCGNQESHWKSMRNMVEVAVIDDIVTRLREEFLGARKKLSIGVIAPYKAQVQAIEDRIGKHNADSSGGFSVNVRSVDGFQGGEEDIIIISTVRYNKTGDVGFLSNRQRTNVALTRARHCLWIVGNGPTLASSGSIWRNLVDDAKRRRCYHDAEDDMRLSCAITVSLFELGLLNPDSILFRDARWKVCLCDDFLKSLEKGRHLGDHKETIYMLQKLADGWRPAYEKGCLPSNIGTSAKLLKHCRITDHLMLIWSVDILREDLYQTQVMRVWDILPLKDREGIAKNLEIVFSQYSTEKMQLCQYESMERNLVVPMRWPVLYGESDSASLSRQLAAVNLNSNQNTTTNATAESLVVPMQWPFLHKESDPARLSTQLAAVNFNNNQHAAANATDENLLVPMQLPVLLNESDPANSSAQSVAVNLNSNQHDATNTTDGCTVANADDSTPVAVPQLDGDPEGRLSTGSISQILCDKLQLGSIVSWVKSLKYR